MRAVAVSRISCGRRRSSRIAACGRRVRPSVRPATDSAVRSIGEINKPLIPEVADEALEIGAAMVRFHLVLFHQSRLNIANPTRIRDQLPDANANAVDSEVDSRVGVQNNSFTVQIYRDVLGPC